MKIAVASNDGKRISFHLGRTKGFVVFEIEGKEIKSQEYRPTTVTGDARESEDAGHEIHSHAPVLNALKDCKAVISHGMGRRIYNDLKKRGIKPFNTDETDVEKAIRLYLSGELIDRPEIGCSHNHE